MLRQLAIQNVVLVERLEPTGGVGARSVERTDVVVDPAAQARDDGDLALDAPHQSAQVEREPPVRRAGGAGHGPTVGRAGTAAGLRHEPAPGGRGCARLVG